MKRFEYETYDFAWGYVSDGLGGVRQMTAREIREMNERFAPFLLRSIKEVSAPACPALRVSVPTGSGR